MQLPFHESFDKRHIPIQDGELYFYEHFLTPTESKTLFEFILHHTKWEQGEIILFGKKHLEPRLRKSYGDKHYTYSNSTIFSEKPPVCLQKIQTKIEELTNTRYNTILLNYYRNENDSMGWHQDNEKELGQNPTIASLTLGETRSFHLKHLHKKDIPTLKLPLTSGSLLLMKGKTQHFWKHQIPKTKKPLNPRVNITFRLIK